MVLRGTRYTFPRECPLTPWDSEFQVGPGLPRGRIHPPWPKLVSYLEENDLNFADMPHRNILMSKHRSESETYGLRFLENICAFSKNRFVPKHFVLQNFLSDSRPYHEAATKRAAWHFQAARADFIRICSFFPASCLKILWGFSPEEPTLSFSGMSFPQMAPCSRLHPRTCCPTCWKLRGNKDFLHSLRKGSFPQHRPWRSKLPLPHPNLERR